MANTIFGFMIYKVHAHLKEEGYDILYDDIVYALKKALIDLDHSLDVGNSIQLPSGSTLTKTFCAGKKCQ